MSTQDQQLAAYRNYLVTQGRVQEDVANAVIFMIKGFGLEATYQILRFAESKSLIPKNL